MSHIEPESLELPRGSKCYNGCYDDETKLALARQAKVWADIKAKIPKAHCTYFPEGEFYRVTDMATLKPVSAEHKTKGAALAEVYNALYGEEA